MSTVRFRVRGLPVAQGSARAFISKGKSGARAIVVTDGSRPNSPIGAWRGSIATEARSAMGETAPVLEGPVSVAIAFYLPRPKAHFHTPGQGGGIRETAPTWHTSAPDIDKLTRAVLDAITAVVVRDDSQVGELVVRKLYEQVDHPLGASIAVAPL